MLFKQIHASLENDLFALDLPAAFAILAPSESSSQAFQKSCPFFGSLALEARLGPGEGFWPPERLKAFSGPSPASKRLARSSIPWPAHPRGPPASPRRAPKSSQGPHIWGLQAFRPAASPRLPDSNGKGAFQGPSQPSIIFRPSTLTAPSALRSTSRPPTTTPSFPDILRRPAAMEAFWPASNLNLRHL